MFLFRPNLVAAVEPSSSFWASGGHGDEETWDHSGFPML